MWMKAAQDGDAVAYQRLLRDCLPIIAGTVRAQGVPPDRVDDVVQDTLLTIHRARATYDPARPFLPWLRAIARRRAIDAARRTGRAELPGKCTTPTPTRATPARGRRGEPRRSSSRIAARLVARPSRPCRRGQRQAVEHLAIADRVAGGGRRARPGAARAR